MNAYPVCRRLHGFAVLAVLSLALAACGGGDPEDEEPPPDCKTAVAPPPGKSVPPPAPCDTYV